MCCAYSQSLIPLIIDRAYNNSNNNNTSEF